jgi:formamidopyrimidine-DNA glycosylase
VTQVVVRQPKLRWPIPASLSQLEGQVIESVSRRAKYLLLETLAGTCIIHLGMSGNLRILPSDAPPTKHDHVDIIFRHGKLLRLNDPRRFGAVLWTLLPASEHALLAKLGPEPLSDAFDEDLLFRRSRGRSLAVKQLVMDNHVVVGVGNIYANEALFRAGIHPKRAAGQVSKARYETLTIRIKSVLAEAIEQGGTTLRDFAQADGKPGYFKQTLAVYGRDNQPCPQCGTAIKSIRIGQRNTFYCPECQR